MDIFGFTLPNFTSQAAASYKANIDAAIAAISAGLTGNILINGDGMINQRLSASGIADDTYDCDRWYALTQTGTIAYSQVTAAADNVPFMMRMTQSQVSAQRMGRAQIVEGKNCKWLRGQQVTLALRHKISSAANIRMAILEWTGTEDSVTSDVVNSWTNSTYTAGNFFNSTTLTVRAVSAAISSTTSLAEATLTTTLGSTFNNLIVVIWTEGTAAQNVTLDLAAQLGIGGAAQPWVKRSYSEEMALCQRYCVQSGTSMTIPGFCVSTTVGHFVWKHGRMRSPSASYTLAIDAGGSSASIKNTGGNVAVTSQGSSTGADEEIILTATVASGLTAGQGVLLNSNFLYRATAEL